MTTATDTPMTTEELMARVRRLRITTGRRVDDLFAGEYHSAFRGLGMEFAEVREYQPGDEVRSIDWNVTARAGRPFVKRFTEERQLTVVLAVDGSASNEFGTRVRTKRDLAAEACATLALAAERNGDLTGLMLFAGEPEFVLPPGKGARHVLRVIRETISFRAQSSGTGLGAAIERLDRVLRRRAVIFLLSDFLADPREDQWETPLARLSRRHDVVAAVLRDPLEEALPRAGLLDLRDIESGRRLLLDTDSRRLRRMFSFRAAERDRDLASRLARARAGRVVLRTDQPPADALARFFRQRERGR